MVWLVEYASELLNRFQAQTRDGKTSHERKFGKRARRALAAFGEVVAYVLLGHSVQDDHDRRVEQAEPKFGKGISLGTERDTNEFRIGSPQGVVKALSLKRLPRDQQWSSDMVANLVGVPWDPRGRKGSSGAATVDGDGAAPEKVQIPGSDEQEEELPADDCREIRFDSRTNVEVRFLSYTAS